IVAPLGLGLTLAIGLGPCLSLQAPSITALATNLLRGGLQQDAGQIITAYVQAATQPHKKENAQNSVKDDGVNIIGDSVTLVSRKYLLDHMKNVDIDAEGNRTMEKAYNVLINAQNLGRLKRNVVICIGTNSLDDYQQQTEKVIKDLKPGHHLIFITPHDGHADSSY